MADYCLEAEVESNHGAYSCGSIELDPKVICRGINPVLQKVVNKELGNFRQGIDCSKKPDCFLNPLSNPIDPYGK